MKNEPSVSRFSENGCKLRIVRSSCARLFLSPHRSRRSSGTRQNARHLFHFLELPSLLGPGLGDDIGLEHAPSRNVAVMFTDFGYVLF